MIALILVAAGSGERLGAGKPKALVEVAGDTLIGHCLRVVDQIEAISHTIVVAPATETSTIAGELPGVTVVAGGAARAESVRAGLAAVPQGTRFVLIHDAARPFMPARVFSAVIDALTEGEVAVIPGLPVTDTIKTVAHEHVRQTVDRSTLVAVQTPQGFRLPELRAAHAGPTESVTDDATLMERQGIAVRVVAGSPEGFKITTPFDLAVARALREG